jgi:hypothetical protein
MFSTRRPSASEFQISKRHKHRQKHTQFAFTNSWLPSHEAKTRTLVVTFSPIQIIPGYIFIACSVQNLQYTWYICNTVLKCDFRSQLSLDFHANIRHVSTTQGHHQVCMKIFVGCHVVLLPNSLFPTHFCNQHQRYTSIQAIPRFLLGGPQGVSAPSFRLSPYTPSSSDSPRSLISSALSPFPIRRGLSPWDSFLHYIPAPGALGSQANMSITWMVIQLRPRISYCSFYEPLLHLPCSGLHMDFLPPPPHFFSGSRFLLLIVGTAFLCPKIP